MGFFDKDVRSSFDRMFDWNRDGKLDLGERAAQFEFEEEMMAEDNSYYDDDDDSELFENDYDESEFEDNDYDPDDYDDFDF